MDTKVLVRPFFLLSDILIRNEVVFDPWRVLADFDAL
jgi:hypothetical protein